MKRAVLILSLSLAVACLAGALSSELFAGKEGASFLDAAKATEPKSITARELRIVDDKGRERVNIDARGLTIFDADGKVRILLICAESKAGPFALFASKSGATANFDACGATIADAKRKVRVLLDQDGLLIADAKEKVCASLDVNGPHQHGPAKPRATRAAAPRRTAPARRKGSKPETPAQALARFLEIDEATAYLLVRNPGLRPVIAAKLGLRGVAAAPVHDAMPGINLQRIADALEQANRSRLHSFRPR